MRVPTSLVYARANGAMGSLNERANALQTQLSTNTRLITASDDPVGYRQLTAVRRATADARQDAANVKQAQTLLDASDAALSEVETQLQRVNELAIKANSGSLSPEQRELIATELDGIVEDMLRLANTADANGAPLFGGNADTAYVRASDGSISYAGSGNRGAIPIGDGASVQPTTTGDQAFGAMFASVQSFAANLRGGTSATGAIDDVKAALASVGTARASIGVRGARLELEADRIATAQLDREETRSAIEDVDITATVTELQKTLTVLQATQASFTKLTSLSLFNYLR